MALARNTTGRKKKWKEGKSDTPIPTDKAKLAQMDEVARAKAEFAKVGVKFRSDNEKMENAAKAIFALYMNLLGKSTLIKWNRIVANQIGTSPWTDLNGHTQDTIQKKMVKPFNDCVKFHLFTAVPQDTSERPQKYYIDVHLEKPPR